MGPTQTIEMRLSYVYITRLHARIPNEHPREEKSADKSAWIVVRVRDCPMEFKLNQAANASSVCGDETGLL